MSIENGVFLLPRLCSDWSDNGDDTIVRCVSAGAVAGAGAGVGTDGGTGATFCFVTGVRGVSTADKIVRLHELYVKCEPDWHLAALRALSVFFSSVKSLQVILILFLS
jgi:hypothetical protein